MSEKKCDFCGTINDTHHSAACIIAKENGTWHESQKEAINKKWVYSDKHAIEKLNRLSQQNAEMLAMLKEIADGGRFTEAEVRALIKKVEGE